MPPTVLRIAFVAVVLSALLSSMPAAEPYSEPTAIVSKDSVLFWFPVDNADGVWRWNTARAGAIEYRWQVDVDTGPFLYHFGFEKTSEEGGAQAGTLDDLLQAGKIFMWRTDNNSGKEFPKLPMGHPVVMGDGLAIELTPARLMFVELILGAGPERVQFSSQGDGVEAIDVSVDVQYLPDPGEAAARAIEGPLSADEYAIYQTILARYRNRDDSFLLLTPTEVAEVDDRESRTMEQRLASLDDGARSAYVQGRGVALDLAALSQLGYEVRDEAMFGAALSDTTVQAQSPPPYVRFSSIGFSESKNEALVFVSYNCEGKRCSEGVLIQLRQRDGNWIITKRATVWKV